MIPLAFLHPHPPGDRGRLLCPSLMGKAIYHHLLHLPNPQSLPRLVVLKAILLPLPCAILHPTRLQPTSPSIPPYIQTWTNRRPSNIYIRLIQHNITHTVILLIPSFAMARLRPFPPNLPTVFVLIRPPHPKVIPVETTGQMQLRTRQACQCRITPIAIDHTVRNRIRRPPPQRLLAVCR